MPSARAVASTAADQIEVVLERLDRRHEDVQDTAARLDAQRRTDDARRRFAAGRRTPRRPSLDRLGRVASTGSLAASAAIVGLPCAV